VANLFQFLGGFCSPWTELTGPTFRKTLHRLLSRGRKFLVECSFHRLSKVIMNFCFYFFNVTYFTLPTSLAWPQIFGRMLISSTFWSDIKLFSLQLRNLKSLTFCLADFYRLAQIKMISIFYFYLQKGISKPKKCNFTYLLLY
jgi:hypothetical protein